MRLLIRALIASVLMQLRDVIDGRLVISSQDSLRACGVDSFSSCVAKYGDEHPLAHPVPDACHARIPLIESVLPA